MHCLLQVIKDQRTGPANTKRITSDAAKIRWVQVGIPIYNVIHLLDNTHLKHCITPFVQDARKFASECQSA